MITAMPSRRTAAAGFTLIEMMIGLVVLALLLGLALPSFTDMLRNGRVRAAAESALFGLQLARSEALKRNAPVSFAYVDNDPTTVATTAPTFSNAAEGRAWVVYFDDGARRELIDSKSSIEGNQSGGIKVLLNLPSAVPGSESRVTFDSLGRPTALNNLGTIDFTDRAAACEHLGGPVRCLRVLVSQAGSVRLCDPKVSAAGDTRACP